MCFPHLPASVRAGSRVSAARGARGAGLGAVSLLRSSAPTSHTVGGFHVLRLRPRFLQPQALPYKPSPRTEPGRLQQPSAPFRRPASPRPLPEAAGGARTFRRWGWSRPIGLLGWEEPRPRGVVVDAAAPGGGESLGGAAAASANPYAKGRGPGQSGLGGGPRRDQGRSWARGVSVPARRLLPSGSWS